MNLDEIQHATLESMPDVRRKLLNTPALRSSYVAEITKRVPVGTSLSEHVYIIATASLEVQKAALEETMRGTNQERSLSA